MLALLAFVVETTNRRNYAIEVFTLLLEYQLIFTEQMRLQLLWKQTINVHGRPRKNILYDFHMEHLNRKCKRSLAGLGANLTDGAIERVGKSLRTSSKILGNFDQLNSIRLESGYHTVQSADANIAKLLKQLHTD